MSLVELFVCLFFFHLALEQKLERITDTATIWVLKPLFDPGNNKIGDVLQAPCSGIESRSC